MHVHNELVWECVKKAVTVTLGEEGTNCLYDTNGLHYGPVSLNF